MEPLDAAIDIWSSGPEGVSARSRRQRTGARPPVLVLQRRPARRRRHHDRRAGDRCARHDLGRLQARRARVFLLVRRALASQLPETGRAQPECVGRHASPSTTASRPNKSIDDQGYIHGDGVLIYPGEERLHPDEDRGIAGPIATVQLANFRRGLQDHQYLTLAREARLEQRGRRGADGDRAARVLGRGRACELSGNGRALRIGAPPAGARDRRPMIFARLNRTPPITPAMPSPSRRRRVPGARSSRSTVCPSGGRFRGSAGGS